MTIHYLKCWPSHFRAMKDGHKRVEVRLNDRDFSLADYLILHEWDPHRGKSTSEITLLVFQVTHVLTGFGIKDGYVAMSVTDLVPAERERITKEYFSKEGEDN